MAGTHLPVVRCSNLEAIEGAWRLVAQGRARRLGLNEAGPDLCDYVRGPRQAVATQVPDRHLIGLGDAGIGQVVLGVLHLHLGVPDAPRDPWETAR